MFGHAISICSKLYGIFIMGCEQSIQIQSSSSDDKTIGDGQHSFQLQYKQFIMNSRIQVFKIYHLSTLIHRSNTSVLRVIVHRKNQQRRVCKIKSFVNFKEFGGMKEVQILKMFENPNIIRLHEYFIENDSLYIVLDESEGETLEKWFLRQKQLDTRTILSIMKQIFLTVTLIHSKNIAHRAIHPAHIMIQEHEDQNNQSSYFIKLIDFNWAQDIGVPHCKPVRPYKHVLMEYNAQNAFNSRQSLTHALQHDIYCCGLIFLMLLGGLKSLQKIRGNQQNRLNQLFKEKPELVSFKNLLSGILEKDPQKRMKSTEAVNSLQVDSLSNQNMKILINQMLKFNVKGSLSTSFWMFATINFSQNKHKFEFLNQFYCLDTNHDGKIQFQQMQNGLQQSFNLSAEDAKEQTKQIFMKIDKNLSGEIDFYEFMLGYFAVGKRLSNKELKQIFTEIDTNEDGYISEEEFNNAIQGLEDFELLDSKKGVTFDEFKRLMQKYLKKISGQEQLHQS